MEYINQVVITVNPQSKWLSKNGLKKYHGRTTSLKTKEDRAKAKEIAEKVKPLRWGSPEGVEVDVTQYYSNTPLDFDGLACAVGPSIDGIIDAGIIVDDSPTYIWSYVMSHEKVDHRHQNRVEIRVTSVSR